MVLAYRELGAGPPVLLLHGWPTSSYLWRRVLGPLARRHRVVALDLPGFGGSDKPTGVRYSFGFFERAIDGFLAALQIDGEIGVADPAAISEQVAAAVTDPFTGGDDGLALAAAGIGLSVRGFTEKAVRKKPRNGIAAFKAVARAIARITVRGTLMTRNTTMFLNDSRTRSSVSASQ